MEAEFTCGGTLICRPAFYLPFQPIFITKNKYKLKGKYGPNYFVDPPHPQINPSAIIG